MLCCMQHSGIPLSYSPVFWRKTTPVLTSAQEKEDVTDIIIDERPAPVEVDEPPSVHDRKSAIPSISSGHGANQRSSQRTTSPGRSNNGH